MVKVDDRKKLCSITQKFLYYLLAVAWIEKDCIETEVILLGRHRKAKYGVKKVQIQTLNFLLVFCCISNLLIRSIISRLRTPMERTLPPKKKKMGLVNFRPFTSSLLIFNYLSLPHLVSPLNLQKRIVPFLPPGVCKRSICFPWLRICVQDLGILY